MKNALTKVLAIVDALKVARADGVNASKPTAPQGDTTEQSILVKSNAHTVYTPPQSSSGAVHINSYFSSTVSRLQESLLVRGRVVRLKSDSGVVTKTPIRTPLPL